MTGDPALRWVRVLTLASLLFLSGLAGHTAAGGATPATPVLIPVLLLIVVVVTQFVGAPLSSARIVVLLVAGQGLLHAVLQPLGGSSLTGMKPMSDAATDAAAVSATTSSHHMAHFGGVASHDWAMSFVGGAQIVMLLAHLAAALVVGMWLAVGERALRTLLAFTVRPIAYTWRSVIDVARRAIGAVGVGFPRPQPGWALRYSIRSTAWVATVVSRRGPPGTASPKPYAYAAVSTV
jgi:hypothetical protein